MPWLRDHASHDSDVCLIWPFSRKANSGYGHLQFEGQMLYAHRVMCEFAHGKPPSSAHEASHSCGNGNNGCVNPIHLSWKTASENHKDRREHGTAATSRSGQLGKLTADQKAQIRALEGQHTKTKLGAMFGVNRRTVDRVLREDPSRVLKINPFKPVEDEYLRDAVRRKLPISAMAKYLGRTDSSVNARLRWLRKGLPRHRR